MLKSFANPPGPSQNAFSRFLAAAFLGVGLLLLVPNAAFSQDWISQIRELAASKKYAEAQSVIAGRLAQAPGDMEAIGWRGRVHAWAGNFSEAERDYRSVLAAVPHEVEILVALADLLAWQQRFAEALETLDRAAPLAAGTPLESEIALRRGRALRALGRTAEARAAFSAELRRDPSSQEARRALEGMAPPLRHELRAGLDYDLFSFTGDAQAYTVSLRSQVASRWVTHAALTFFNRFGEKPVRGSGAVTYKASAKDAFTVGAAVARHRGIIARNEVFYDYNRGVRISETAPLRGLEWNFAQRWLWFDGAQIMTLTPAAIFYLPRDWTFTLQTTAARSRFAGTGVEWRPSGLARLTFPVHPRVTLNSFFAVGTENFSRVDQVGRFSARTWGGGGKWQFTPRQDLACYALYQDRSQRRSQTSFGMSYGFRF